MNFSQNREKGNKILLKFKDKLERFNWLGGDKKLLSKSCCQVSLNGMIEINFAIHELSSVSIAFCMIVFYICTLLQ
jgi:hypothetical protein